MYKTWYGPNSGTVRDLKLLILNDLIHNGNKKSNKNGDNGDNGEREREMDREREREKEREIDSIEIFMKLPDEKAKNKRTKKDFQLSNNSTTVSQVAEILMEKKLELTFLYRLER